MSLLSVYKRLEYIESSGTQYIDTGIVANNNSKAVLDVEWLSTNTAWMTVFGSYDTKNYFSIWHQNISDFLAYIGTGNYKITAGISRVSISLTASKFSVNETETEFSQSINATSNLYLFHIYGQDSYKKAVMKLYSCQIYDNDVLVRDFVPCINASGEVGLYDLVGKQFYGNAGTGTFTAGSVIAIAADASEITKLEYIQSNGTQYIDTGIVPKNNTRVDADCDITYGTDWIMILGSYDPKKYFSWWANGAKIYAYYGTSNKIVAGENGRQTLSANKNIWTAGNSTISFSEASFTANTSIYLFSVNNGGNYSKASMKLYSCRIYDNGTLVRDFIAAKLSDGTIGLYDKLSGLLYINAGTGTFEAGPSSLNLPVNIGGTWKDANEVFVNIGGTWKAVETAFVNIGGTWKELG